MLNNIINNSYNNFITDIVYKNYINIFNTYNNLNYYNNINIENSNNFNNNYIENTINLYNYSIPNVKLYYPEPFISTSTFLHYDLWFIHVSIYQYWLWFFFIFIIIFFTMTFLSTLRWCNLRVNPQRETRGVSRSKCGDLITAIVPVSWASSIIIHETTDAIEYYDGFGTTEMAVGIRAYQWGWEYYYPKDIDLNYYERNYNNFFIGKSLSYNNYNSEDNFSNNFWNFYKNKSLYDNTITPSHLIINSTSSKNFLNNIKNRNFSYAKILLENGFKSGNTTRYVDFSNKLNYSLFNKNYYKTNILIKNTENTLNSSFKKFNSRSNELNYLSTNSLNNYSAQISSPKHLNRFLLNNYSINLNKINLLDNNLNKLFYNIDNLNFLIFNNFKYFLNNYFLNEESSNLDIYLNLFNKFKDFDLIIKNFNIFNSNTNLEKNYTKISDNIFFQFEKKIIKKFDILGFSNNNNFKNIELLEYLKKNINYKNSTYINKFSFNNNFKNNSNILNNNFKNYSNLNKEFRINLNFITKKYNINKKTPFFSQYNLNYFINNDNNSNSIDLNNYINSNFFNKFDNQDKFILNLNYIVNNIHIFKWPFIYSYADIDFNKLVLNEFMEDIFWQSNLKKKIIKDLKINKKENTFSDKKNYLYNYSFFLYDKLNLFNNFNIKNQIFNDFNLNNFNNFNNFYLNKYTNYENIIRSEINTFNNILNYNLKNIKSFNYHKFYQFFYKLNKINIFKIYKNYIFSQNSYIKLIKFSSNTDNKYIFNIYKNSNTSNFNNLKYKNFLELLVINNKDMFKLLNLLTFKLNNNLIHIEKDFLNNIKLFNFYNMKKIIKKNIKLSLNFIKINFKFKNFLKNSINSSLKDVNLTSNAIWKIYKPSFADERLNTDFKQFSNSENKLPFLTTTSSFKKIISKNYVKTLNNNIFKENFKIKENINNIKNNFIRYYSFDFPFLTALEEDELRYVWFDWYSKTNQRVAKSLDTTKYSLTGSKIYKNNNDFNELKTEDINTMENYLIKLANARKVYNQVWTNSPFILNKYKYWYNNTIILSIFSLNTNKNNPINLVFLNKFMKSYEFSINIGINGNLNFKSSISNTLLPIRNYIRTLNSFGSYNYYSTNLFDILIKRDYLIRLLLKNNYIFLNNSINEIKPTNPLILNLKSFFFTTNQVESKTEDFKFKYFKFITDLNYFYSNAIVKNFYTYIYKTNNYNKINYSNNTNMFKKSQYKQMRKSVSNMIRIQSDKAVAMPTDTRLQILTVSKDIIHSWAIPSAGIKIDCIPGYSSHKVTIFLLSGVYWGQCMEICGRFHHWMPIIVYFMKRDLFILWCIHFIFVSRKENEVLEYSNKRISDFISIVSYDKKTWSNEI